MIYVMSDLHGRLDLFEKMLDKINFSEDDKLFVLGDMVDRGGDLSLLLRIQEMQKKGQCVAIMGNHEKMLLDTLNCYIPKADLTRKFEEVDQRKFIKSDNDLIASLFEISSKMKHLNNQIQLMQIQTNLLRCFNSSGANEYTFDSLNMMNLSEINSLKNYVQSMPTGVKLNVNGKVYLLVHAGYDESKEQVNPGHKFDMREEFFTKKVVSSEELTVVFGHTPTSNIKLIKEHKLKIPSTIWYDKEYGDKIGIDCGACYPHGQLACLCLDTMEEYYIENDMDTIVPFSYLNKRMDILKEMVDDVNRHYAPDAEHEIKFFK